jgi:hypothetical protein
MLSKYNFFPTVLALLITLTILNCSFFPSQPSKNPDPSVPVPGTPVAVITPSRPSGRTPPTEETLPWQGEQQVLIKMSVAGDAGEQRVLIKRSVAGNSGEQRVRERLWQQ